MAPPDTIIFLLCNNLLITSKTVVFLTNVLLLSKVIGVYPVIKKWHLGVGTKGAIKLIISLFIYPGYLKVVVDEHITVLIKLLTWDNEGDSNLILSVAILYKAPLSKTITLSVFKINLFNVNIEL